MTCPLCGEQILFAISETAIPEPIQEELSSATSNTITSENNNQLKGKIEEKREIETPLCPSNSIKESVQPKFEFEDIHKDGNSCRIKVFSSYSKEQTIKKMEDTLFQSFAKPLKSGCQDYAIYAGSVKIGQCKIINKECMYFIDIKKNIVWNTVSQLFYYGGLSFFLFLIFFAFSEDDFSFVCILLLCFFLIIFFRFLLSSYLYNRYVQLVRKDLELIQLI
jgi:hypothetical protein